MTTHTQKAYKPSALNLKCFEMGSSLFTAGEAVELRIVAENTAEVRLISYGVKIGYWKRKTFVPILDFGRNDCYWEEGKSIAFGAVATASGANFDALHAGMLEAGERAQNGFTAQFTLGTAAGEELIEYYPMSKDIYLLDRKYAPAIAEDFEIVRCSADGRPSMTGEHVSITAKISPDTPPEGFDCRLDYGRAGVAFEQSSDLQEDIGKLIAGIDHDADLISLLFDRYTAYDFMLYYGDQYENVSAKCTIPGVLDHLGLDNAGNIHVTGEVSAAMESDIPAYFHGGIANIQTGTVMATTKTPSNNCSDHPILFEKPFAAGTVPTVIVGLVSSSTAARFGVCTCAVLDGSVTNEGFTIRFYNSDVSSRLPGFSYSSTGKKSQTIGSSGCGPTSMSDIMATWINKKITPVEMCDYSLKHGYRTASSGTAWGFFKSIAKAYGYSGFVQTKSMATARAAINAGALVVASMGPGYWTKGGHYICLWRTDDTYMYANDPASSTRKKQKLKPFEQQRKQFFIFYKPGSLGAAV